METRPNSQKQVQEGQARRLAGEDREPVQSEHNLEDGLQEFKETEMVKLQHKYGFKIVCKICFRANKTQTEKPASTSKCPTHPDKWIPLRIHHTSQSEIRPLPQVEGLNSYKFELCRNYQQSKCGRKDQCSRAHNQHELHVWKAEQAILYPRLCPPKKCANAPQLCADMAQKKRCQRGHVCFGAHSNVELRIWQMRYQKTKEDLETRMWQAEVEDTVQKAVLKHHTTDRLMEIHKMCVKIAADHKAELGHIVKMAANTLIQCEVRRRENDAGSPPPPQQHRHTPSESNDYKCPFMLSHVDYARRFEDQLSLFLHVIINEVDLTEASVASTMTDNCIDEEQYDSRKLLSHMKEHTHQYAKKFSMDPDLLYCYCIFLKQIGNQLAHKGYLVAQNQEIDSALRVVGRRAYVEVYLEYSYDLTTKISQKTEFQHQVHIQELKRIWQSFTDYCQCKKRHDTNRERYSRLSEREQERVAEEVIKQLQERVKTDKCYQRMLGTYIPALMGIDINALADGMGSSSSQDKALPF